jgi:putative membrane protein
MWSCGSWLTGFHSGFGNFFMGFGPFGGVLRLLLVILVISLVVKLIMSIGPKPNATPDKKDSLGILKNRLAKGEITQEEYHRMRETLMS